jgi:hypothetical protein
MSISSNIIQFQNATATPRTQKASKHYPFSLRFTEAERAWLLRQAETLSLAAYIRLQLFKDFKTAPPSRQKLSRKVASPSSELAVLGTMLGGLGQSQLVSHLNQIAKAANQGALPVTPELETELFDACAAIQDMRKRLIAALGVKAQ